MSFEWDNKKNELNILKHEVDFLDAALVFDDCNRIEIIDDRKDYGEVRYRTIGMVKGVMFSVIHTPRQLKHRIISARRANKYEKNLYLYSQNTSTRED
jgi:uncharacterized protein